MSEISRDGKREQDGAPLRDRPDPIRGLPGSQKLLHCPYKLQIRAPLQLRRCCIRRDDDSGASDLALAVVGHEAKSTRPG